MYVHAHVLRVCVCRVRQRFIGQHVPVRFCSYASGARCVCAHSQMMVLKLSPSVVRSLYPQPRIAKWFRDTANARRTYTHTQTQRKSVRSGITSLFMAPLYSFAHHSAFKRSASAQPTHGCATCLIWVTHRHIDGAKACAAVVVVAIDVCMCVCVCVPNHTAIGVALESCSDCLLYACDCATVYECS